MCLFALCATFLLISVPSEAQKKITTAIDGKFTCGKWFYDDYDSVKYEAVQTFKVVDWDMDTLNLKLDPKCWMFYLVPQIFFPYTDVHVKKKENEEWKKVKYVFDGVDLKIPLPSRNCHVKLRYGHRSATEYQHYWCGPYLQMFLATTASWFFVTSGISVEDMTISIPDEGYIFFANVPYEPLKPNVYRLDVSKRDDLKYSMGVVKPCWYQKLTVKKGRYCVNMYCRDSIYFDTTASDTVRRHVGIGQGILERRKKEMDETLGVYAKWFGDRKDRVFDIFDGDLVQNGVAWSTVLHSNGYDTITVLLDNETGWGNTLRHEMLHEVLDVNPLREDTSYFLFHESLVEYLSVTLFDSEEETMEKFVKSYVKYRKYANDSLDGVSIFGIKENKARNDASGTYGIIYSKTPLVLHRFSQKIGKTRFLNILQGFYGEVFETGVINMEVFERHLKKGGVSEEQYRQLVRDLSNPIMKNL